jgi:chromosome segregation ATPase
MSTNGSTTSRSSNRPKFSAQVQDLLGAAKKVLSHEKDIVSLDQILDEKKEVEGKLKSKAAEVLAKDKVIASKDQEIASLQLAKNKEIAKLQLRNDSLFEEFQRRYKAWDTGTTKQEELAEEVAQLKLKLGQATNKADSSNGELTLRQQEFAERQGALENAEEKLKSVSKELGSKDRELTGAITKLEYLQDERTALGLEDLDHRDL